MKIIEQNKSEEPVLLDKVIDEIIDNQKAKLTWIDNAFRLAYTLEHESQGKKFRYPAIYTERNNYHSVLPDDTLGNFSFIEKKDPETVIARAGYYDITVDVDIIFWFNLSKIYDTDKVVMLENIKDDVLKLFNSRSLFKESSITINKVYTNAENIFEGYDLKQVENQFLMMPYAGIKLSCTLRYTSPC